MGTAEVDKCGRQNLKNRVEKGLKMETAKVGT